MEVAYLLSFSRSLPNYCIIILETIFFIGFAARLFNSGKKLLYLSLLLITSIIFTAIETMETTWIISNIASFVICIIIYAFIVAKDLEDSKAIRIILLLNTAVFFGAIFLLSENTNMIPRNEYYYMYLFCIMCFLAFLLLYVLDDRILNFNEKSLRLRNIPDLAFIGFIFFIFSAIIFCDKCGLGLIYNLIGSLSYEAQHLEIYAIFTIMCGSNLWFFYRFFSNLNLLRFWSGSRYGFKKFNLQIPNKQSKRNLHLFGWFSLRKSGFANNRNSWKSRKIQTLLFCLDYHCRS